MTRDGASLPLYSERFEEGSTSRFEAAGRYDGSLSFAERTGCRLLASDALGVVPPRLDWGSGDR